MTGRSHRVYCLIGDPVSISLGPKIHNASFAEVGINAVYVAFQVQDATAAVNGIRALGYRVQASPYPTSSP